jgi:hypothetical protein
LRYLPLYKNNFDVFNIIKVVILFISILYITYLLITQYNRFEIVLNQLDIKTVWVFLILQGMLMMINFFIEAFKWGRYVNKNSITKPSLNYFFYFKQVFIGHYMGMIIPMGIGDYIGRYHKKMDVNVYIKAVFLSKNTQMMITSFSMIMVALTLYQQSIFYILATVALVCIIVIVLMIGKFQKIFKFLKFMYFKLFNRQLKIKTQLYQFNLKESLSMSFFSALRYIVFIIQFLICIHFVGIRMEIGPQIGTVVAVYFVKSIIPTWFDFGIRELSATYFFNMFNVSMYPVLVASFLLWLINFIVPFFIGMYLFIKFKK